MSTPYDRNSDGDSDTSGDRQDQDDSVTTETSRYANLDRLNLEDEVKSRDDDDAKGYYQENRTDKK